MTSWLTLLHLIMINSIMNATNVMNSVKLNNILKSTIYSNLLQTHNWKTF